MKRNFLFILIILLLPMIVLPLLPRQQYVAGRMYIRERGIAASLYTKVLIPDENIIYPWEQPESTNPYKKGDKVTRNNKTWISLIDGNVWEPGVPSTWEEVIE